MLKPEFTGQFKRDYKLAIKRGCDSKKLEEVLLCSAMRNRCQRHIVIMRLRTPEIIRT